MRLALPGLPLRRRLQLALALVVAAGAVASWAIASGPDGWGVPSVIGKDLRINGDLTIVGQNDTTHLIVRAASGQPSGTDLFVVEVNSGTDSFMVDDNAILLGAAGDGLAAVTTVLEATGSMLVDADLFPTTLSDPFGGAAPFRIGVTSGTTSATGGTCQFTQTGGVSSQSCWTATHASSTDLAAAGTRSGFRARPRGAVGDNATAINACFYGQAPFTLSGGRDAILASDATTYEYAVLTASGSVTTSNAVLTLSTLNDDGGAANDVTIAPAAAATSGVGGDVNVNPSAGAGGSDDGDLTVTLPATGQGYFDCDTTANTNNTGCVLIDSENAAANDEATTIRVRATADVDGIGALTLVHLGTPTALTGTNSRHMVLATPTCNGSDASGSYCAGFRAGDVTAGGGQEAALWVSGTGWEYGYLSNANAGHMGSTGSAPTLSSCGTGPTISGNDVAGKVTAGTTAIDVNCTVTFSTAYRSAPACIITPNSSGATATTTTTALEITTDPEAVIQGIVFMYICHEGS